MALDPTPFHCMTRVGHQLVEFLPKIGIFDRLLGCGSPSFGFPAMDPFCDAFSHILAVQLEGDFAGPLEGLEGFNDSGQLHAVVGRVQFTAKQLPHMLTRSHQDAPAARAGVAFASTIGMDFNVIHIHSFSGYRLAARAH